MSLHRASQETIGNLVKSTKAAIQYYTDRNKARRLKTSVKHQNEENLKVLKKRRSCNGEYLPVIISFCNVSGDVNRQNQFALTVRSLLQHSSVGILFFIAGDLKSQEIGRAIIDSQVENNRIRTAYRVVDIDENFMAKTLRSKVEHMPRLFRESPGSSLDDIIVYLSVIAHHILPDSIHKVIMIDPDLKFYSDIKHLYSIFDEFSRGAMIGIARENQPTYRHLFSTYRSLHRDTRIGQPPPHGITGFNSGVLLLNLEKMRTSKLYNKLISKHTISKLCDKYYFKGRYADQDCFTLISTENEKLFHIIPCGWNRQLWTWYRDNGYKDVFDQYYKYDGPVYVHHGNQNTPIPEE